MTTVEEGEKPYNIRHRCFHFSKSVIHFVKNCTYEKIYVSMFDQLLRSATSIGANMVEGGAGSTNKDFINFMHISLKSTNETKYWLCLIRETLVVNEKVVNDLIKEANELSKIIAQIIINAKR
ncbi:four helix bundle protein [Aridibaculum aurantiacum]|uniref:four helix bundle protein n=1 Tax=Aridibaculum aurantiacum TaxID=2810307 RepID=UPI001A962A48|nr:four helix bundle protein [Aridibaculum aurantiacum]